MVVVWWWWFCDTPLLLRTWADRVSRQDDVVRWDGTAWLSGNGGVLSGAV